MIKQQSQFIEDFLKIPLIGAFILNAEVERFSRVMHLMMKSGLNLDVSMQQASVVIGNKYIAKSVRRCQG